MAILQYSDLDFQGLNKLLNLPQATNGDDAVTLDQMLAAIENISWKSSVRAASVGNINLAAPGATVDGVTMVQDDRFLAKDQTLASEVGIYIWNGAASPATRSSDANTFRELEGSVVRVEEGTNAGSQWRQTQVNGTIDVDDLVFVPDTSSAPPATETVPGIAEAATQAEVDGAVAGFRFVTPETLDGWSGRLQRYEADFGDGSATSYAFTHNLNSLGVHVEVSLKSTGATIGCQVLRTDANTVTLGVNPAPASNSMTVIIKR